MTDQQTPTDACEADDALDSILTVVRESHERLTQHARAIETVRSELEKIESAVELLLRKEVTR